MGFQIKFFIHIALLCFISPYLSAQNHLPIADIESLGISKQKLEELDMHMHSYVDNGQLAGIQIAIIKNGNLVHFDTYGYSHIENEQQLQHNSIFRLFSMTKPIVSVALMQLYEAGKFKLEDPISKYIPAFKNMTVQENESVALRLATNPILIIDLLRHTSGIGYGRGDNGRINDLYRNANLRSSKNLDEFIEKLSAIPLYFEPGTNYQYGQSVDVCGYLIEVISGQKLDKYLEEYIFKPLEMNDTYFELPQDKIDRFTTGYRAAEDGSLYVSELPHESWFANPVTLFLGGGGLVSTTSDYIQFCKMLLNKGHLNGKVILKPETILLMTKDHTQKAKSHQDDPLRFIPGETGFGLGFSIASTSENGERGVYGWGGAVGTYFRIDPDKDLAYIMMIQLSPYRQLGLREVFQNLVNNCVIN